jgi:hypothetical protein
VSRNLGSESWEEFCARVRASSDTFSWRWAAIARRDDEWNLIALVIEAGATDSPTQRVDRYPRAIVAVEELVAESAVARLRAFTATAEGDDPAVPIPEQQNAVPHQIYSGDEWGLTPAGWPRVVVDAGAGGAIYADPSEPLSAQGAPFYPSLGQAVAERVFRVPPDRVRMNQLAPLSFRLVDRRGRIAALDAEADGMAVRVEEGIEGGLAGFHLHLLWRPEPDDDEWSRSDRALSETENLSLATDGVPAEFVAALIDPDGLARDRSTRFVHDLQKVALDGALAEAQARGDLGPLVAGAVEGEDLALSLGQRVGDLADQPHQFGLVLVFDRLFLGAGLFGGELLQAHIDRGDR